MDYVRCVSDIDWMLISFVFLLCFSFFSCSSSCSSCSAVPEAEKVQISLRFSVVVWSGLCLQVLMILTDSDLPFQMHSSRLSSGLQIGINAKHKADRAASILPLFTWTSSEIESRLLAKSWVIGPNYTLHCVTNLWMTWDLTQLTFITMIQSLCQVRMSTGNFNVSTWFSQAQFMGGWREIFFGKIACPAVWHCYMVCKTILDA